MALVEGVKYGLQSHSSQSGNKAVIFVKLTDSALKAIDDYLKSQHKTGHRATLRFLGNEGHIHIPSSQNDNGHSFDFSLSTDETENPQGSFECIQQSNPRSLVSTGPLSYKMRIKANDDVFVQTQNRFTELEHERQKECAKEIKSNCADIGRKVKKKLERIQPLPQRREKSPSYMGHQPSKPTSAGFSSNSNSNSGSLKLPNGYSNGSSSSINANKHNNINNSSSSSLINNRKLINGGVATGNSPGGGLHNGNAAGINSNSNSFNKNGVNSGESGKDVSRRPLKERLIHMLAVKPYKKPELFQRLQIDGIKDKEKKLVQTILHSISCFKDNEYSLLRGVWNDVQEDWSFYSEQEKQLMKRRKPQNLTPPGSDSSVGSGTSSLSPRSSSSIGSGHSPSSYSHIASYSHKSSSGPLHSGSAGQAAAAAAEINLKGLSPPDFEGGSGGSSNSKGIKRPVTNGVLPGNLEDYGDIPPKKTRVAHIKRPGSGSSSNGSSNGNGANISSNPNSGYRADLLSSKSEGNSNGSSPHFSHSHSNRIAERLSPIGSSNGNSNFSAQQNGSNNGTNGVVMAHAGTGSHYHNHKSPRSNGPLVEPMDVSPSHHNGFHNNHNNINNNHNHHNNHHNHHHSPSPREEPVVSIGSSWQSRNGNDPHGFSSDGEKTGRGDSDETDSVDSGNGSSTSGGSLGGSQPQNGYNNGHHNASSHNGHLNGSVVAPNGMHNNKAGAPGGVGGAVDKAEPISSSVHNSLVNHNSNSSSLTNGCNRVSSTTNFHSTPQSSPDSQMTMESIMQQQKSLNSSSSNGSGMQAAGSAKHNGSSNHNNHHQRPNGKIMNGLGNPEIIVTRDKGDREYRDRDRERRRKEDRERKEKEREAKSSSGSSSKDRMKRSDKKYPRVTTDTREEIENSDGTSVKLSEFPSYLKKYSTISCAEQRTKYKEDFNNEYPEYRDLHNVIDTVSKRFAHLEERLRQEERGTDAYEKIKEQIVNEYYANKRDKKYQDSRQKFQYLHEKLSHIKRLVADYDSQHQQQDQDIPDYSNGY